MFFHNFKSYDSKLVLQFLANDRKHVKNITSVMSDSSESYWSFDIKLRCENCIKRGVDNQTDSEVIYGNVENSSTARPRDRNHRHHSHHHPQQEDSEFSSFNRASLEEEIVMRAEREEEGSQEAIFSDSESESGEEVMESSEGEEEEEAEEEATTSTTAASREERNEAPSEAPRVVVSPPTDCFCDQFLIVRMTDSYKIMSASLSNLVENLKTKAKLCQNCKEGDVLCPICQEQLSKLFPSASKFVQNRGNLIHLKQYLRKNCFPHDLIRDVRELSAIESYPSKKEFFSSLTMEDVCQDIYDHGRKMWVLHNCSNLLEYSQLYLRLDCELLADVYQSFRNMFYDYVGLDIAQYMSIPGISFDSMLKKSQVKLELISDINLFLLIENNLRGGYSGAHKRLSVSNHSGVPYVDRNAATSIIMTQDFASLYADCMTKWLPTSVRWGDSVETEMVKSKFESEEYLQFTGEEDVGYLILCDVEYPEEIKPFLSK